ncbi:MAG: hypothetical protein GYA68_10480 [Syntrophorhabdus sp.]|nr:hypothetical protein [Syntrophorhabdus sp.]
MSFEYAMLPNRKEGIPHNVGASSALYYVTIPPHINLEACHEVFGKQGIASPRNGSSDSSLNTKENLSLVQNPGNR